MSCLLLTEQIIANIEPLMTVLKSTWSNSTLADFSGCIFTYARLLGQKKKTNQMHLHFHQNATIRGKEARKDILDTIACRSRPPSKAISVMFRGVCTRWALHGCTSTSS